MTVVQGKYRYRQIAEELQKRIVAEYNIGDLLPSEAELADTFEVTHVTIRQALEVLADEGWVKRHHGRGTVVADRLLTGEFAIALHPKSFVAESAPSWRCAVMGLVEELRRWNPKFRMNIHLGQLTDDPEDFPATLDLLEPQVFKRLRAVFTFTSMSGLDAVLMARGVPVVSFASDARYCLYFDYKSLIDLALEGLHKKGYRRVGVLRAHYRSTSIAYGFDEMMIEKARSLGMEIRPEWMPPHEEEVITERSGMAQFRKFWAIENKPEALFIADDMLCRGAIRVITEMGIEIPRDLKIVTHATADVEFPYHKSFSRVEFDPLKQVKMGVDMMMNLLAGREPPAEHVKIPGDYIEGETA